MNSKISIIVALDDKNGIGKENGLLWRIPEELKRFREITTGRPIIMGRKTYESIGRPLPNRTNIVITKDPHFKVEGCIVVNSLDNALKEAKNIIQKELDVPEIAGKGKETYSTRPEIFIIGGGQIYKQAIEAGIADKLYVTKVEGDFGTTVFFPDWENIFTKKVFEQKMDASGYKFTFYEYER